MSGALAAVIDTRNRAPDVPLCIRAEVLSARILERAFWRPGERRLIGSRLSPYVGRAEGRYLPPLSGTGHCYSRPDGRHTERLWPRKSPTGARVSSGRQEATSQEGDRCNEIAKVHRGWKFSLGRAGTEANASDAPFPGRNVRRCTRARHVNIRIGCGSPAGTSGCRWQHCVEVAALVDAPLLLAEVVGPVVVPVAVGS